MKASKIDRKGGTAEKITGWADDDHVYMSLKVGQFECTVKAHRDASDGAIGLVSLSSGLLGAFRGSGAL